MYLRGPGAGFHPGAELVVQDLAVVESAEEQTERHRVLLPDEPACITQSLHAREGVSCTHQMQTRSSQTRPSDSRLNGSGRHTDNICFISVLLNTGLVIYRLARLCRSGDRRASVHRRTKGKSTIVGSSSASSPSSSLLLSRAGNDKTMRYSGSRLSGSCLC